MRHPFRDLLVMVLALGGLACVTSDGDGSGGGTASTTGSSAATTSGPTTGGAGGMGGAGGDDELALAAECRAKPPPCEEKPEWPRCRTFDGYAFPLEAAICDVPNDCSQGQEVQVCEWTPKNPGYGAPTVMQFERGSSRYLVYVASMMLPSPEGWHGCNPHEPTCEPPPWWESAQ